MNRFLLFLATVIFPIQIFAQDQTKENEAALPKEQAPQHPFECTILDTEPSNSKVAVNGDSIFFRLFYVDMQCTKFKYEFEREKELLIVRRSSDDELTCDEEEESVYGIEGSVKEVPKGKYILQLESSYDGAKSILFREPIFIK